MGAHVIQPSSSFVDSLMHFQLRLFSLSLIAGLTLACTATAPVSERDSPVAGLESAGEARLTEAEIQYGNFSEEQLFQTITAELQAQQGDIEQASETYYRLAFDTRDLGIVQRATQFASAAGDLNGMIQLGVLWTELDATDINPHLMVSYQLLEAGRFEDAVNHMARIIDLGGQIDFSAISRRTERLNTERRNRLIESLRDLHQLYRDEDSIHYSIVQLLDQNQQTQDALIELQSLRQSYGDSPPIVLIESQLLQKLERTDRALRVLRDGVRKFPKDKPLRFTYARNLVQADDYRTAKRQFEILVEQDPNDFETMYSIALLDLEMEDFDEARSYFERLLQANHRTEDAHYYLGYINEQLQRLEEAIRHYRAVPIGTANFVAAQQQATRFSIELGELDEAHDWLVNLSRGQPRLEVVFTSIEAAALMEAGEFERTRELLNEMLDRYPNDVDLLFARVLMHDNLGDMASSELDLRQIIAVNPNDARALNHLGYMLADRTTRFAEALELIERAIVLSPDDPAIIDSLAWAQYKLGRNEEALLNLRRAFAAFPDHEVASHLGEVLWVLGRQQEAVQVWTDALQERPDSELLKNVMERFQP
ncbi:MAG: tetratricopeptide repeat protein [Pseudohongiellaceae bacterium]